MTITKKFPIPTGYLFTSKGERGELEALSIGDYGKAKNIKADFLGYDQEISGVCNQETMPLTEKWVITISTQYGCTQQCTFCDVPNVPFKGNATFQDLKTQFYNAMALFPHVKYTDRLNLHYARMGEPILNNNVYEFSHWLINNKRQIQHDTGVRLEVIHPVLTTSLPRNFKKLEQKLLEWCDIKNELYKGQAGLQLSINSTDEIQRQEMFKNNTLTLEELSIITKKFPEPIGRKYCLNFALASDYKVDAQRLKELFDPEYFMVKITPIHNNQSCRKNGIATINGYDSYHPYKEAEQSLKENGFDVLVFVPSMDEEDGLVTCGNLVLGGGKLNSNDIIQIKGMPK